MAIRTVITHGFGNGTFNGTIPLVVTRGYISGAAVAQSGSPIKACASLNQRVQTCQTLGQRVSMKTQTGQRIHVKFDVENG